MSPNRSPNLRSLRLFSETIFYTQSQSLNLRFHKESSLCTHKLRDRLWVQSVLRILTSTPSTSIHKLMSPNRSQIWDLSLRLFSGIIFTHKTNLSGSQIPQRVISLHTQTQRPGFRVQSVLRILISTPSTSIHKLMSPNRSPKSEISLRLFSGIIFKHKINLSGSQIPQRVISLHTQTQRPVSRSLKISSFFEIIFY